MIVREEIAIDEEIATEPPPAELEPQIIAWRNVPVPPLPERWSGVLSITATELWCAACGSDGASTLTPHPLTTCRWREPQRPTCWRCGRPTMRRAVEVLRPGEYVVR